MIDRLCSTRADVRLVAHLAADEPAENASLMCSLYLADERGRHCRPLTPRDLETAPFDAGEAQTVIESQGAIEASGESLVDRDGRVYRLGLASSGMSIPELRWHRHPPQGEHGCPERVTVRGAVGGLESYEPVRALTARALAAHHADPTVSVTALRAQLDCSSTSRVVLNRGLREAVLTAVQTQDLSMSEIAIRCGRVKYDSRGNESGETSWLARRIGTLPEGGESAPTPWVCSDVLALIARRGLGVCPREVELG